jgi:DNA-binding CsgD family transcriptional regulator
MSAVSVRPPPTGIGSPHCGCNELLCLLRLSEIALVGPEPEVGVRAMLDELQRMPGIERSVVGLPEPGGARLRYIAHVGQPGRPGPHVPYSVEINALSAQVIDERRLIQLPVTDGSSSTGCLTLPIMAGEQLLGILGLGVRLTIPLDDWFEHVIWAVADLLALVLLDERGAGNGDGAPAGEALRLTRRQRDVIFALVDRGASNAQIASDLGLSARTVKIHLQAAYRQLGVRRRGDAIRLVLTRHGDWLGQERERRQNAVATS